MFSNKLKIGKIQAKFPIIQGGMAVRIATAKLAAAVANEGGIGIIAGTGMSVDELKNEIKKAREMSKGIIGVNVLFAAKEFASLVRGAMEVGIDLIISGAGFSRDMFKWGREFQTPIVPVVSSLKLAKLAERFGAAAVVVEGKEAGGHLGTDRPMKELISEIVGELSIPVIAAGGIMSGKDIKEVIEMGANGVQMGTVFAASTESNASDEMKQAYIRAEEKDVVQIMSPVGYLGQGIISPYTKQIINNTNERVKVCKNCLKNCNHRNSKFTESFCILEALNNATNKQDYEKALLFSGERVSEIKEILSVSDIFRKLQTEYV